MDGSMSIGAPHSMVRTSVNPVASRTSITMSWTFLTDIPPRFTMSLFAASRTLRPALEMYSSSDRSRTSPSATWFDLMYESRSGAVVVSSLPTILSTVLFPSLLSIISLGLPPKRSGR